MAPYEDSWMTIKSKVYAMRNNFCSNSYPQLVSFRQYHINIRSGTNSWSTSMKSDVDFVDITHCNSQVWNRSDICLILIKFCTESVQTKYRQISVNLWVKQNPLVRSIDIPNSFLRPNYAKLLWRQIEHASSFYTVSLLFWQIKPVNFCPISFVLWNKRVRDGTLVKHRRDTVIFSQKH